MSGRQEEESDKVSMYDGRSSGHTKMCSTEREGISTTVRTGERHEVSEKVGMCKAGMPNSESSDGNFVAAGG